MARSPDPGEDARVRILLFALVLSFAVPARAADVRPLRHDWAVDGAVTGGAAVVWLSSELLFKKELAPSKCRWCAVDGFDAAIRNALVWNDPHTADTLSNVGAFALMPLMALGGTALAGRHDGAGAQTVFSDELVIGEATMLALDLDQAVKFAAGRERPFVHALPGNQKSATAKPDDNNLSFFSGHTTWAFGLATAAGTVCSLHHYRLTPVVWAAGLTFATTIGVLRIDADKHWATDVLTGALVGSAFGIGLPRLLHALPPPASSAQGLALSATPASDTVALSVGGRF